MNQTQGTQDPKFTFGKLLVGFVLLEVAIVALSAFWSGCAAVDPDAVYDIYTNIVVRIPDSSAQGVSDVASQSGGAEESTSSIATGGKETDSGLGEKPASASPSVALDFRYGGFNGSKAVEDPNCQIGSLRVSSTSLSYKWVKGGCETLGAKDKGDYSQTLACAFYWDEGSKKWIGGKFDYVSTSRTSRTFENIVDGYGGWDSVAFFKAKKHGFCIVSVNGKKRSNFIED